MLKIKRRAEQQKMLVSSMPSLVGYIGFIVSLKLCLNLWKFKKETYILPSVKTEKGQTSVRYRGPIMWNQIPETLRKEQNKNTFKRKLKKIKDLILQATFNKESALITNKDTAFIYY